MNNVFENIIYKILKDNKKFKKIGKGGQANVYEYIHNNKKYAIRIPKTKLTKHEIKILKKLKNKCLDNIIEVIYFKNSVLVTPVYEYDLNKWMEKKRNDSEWKNFIKDIKNGIENLSSMGVCHRDLKPRNILVKNNRFYITDFGHSWIYGIDENIKTEIKLCILNRQDYIHIINLVPRVKVNNMIKRYNYNEVINFAKKFPDFSSYLKSEKIYIYNKNINENLKKFLLFKSICYFLVEKNHISTNIDGKQKLPSNKIQELIKSEFSLV